jgi:hypothetical protein
VTSLVTLDNLGLTISKLIADYGDQVEQRLEKVLDETAVKVLEFIQSKAPRSGQTESFADSFVAVPNGEGINKTITIFSETKGRLTHLLEFGFTHRGGKYVGPRPFMRPAFDVFAPEMLSEVKHIIEGGGI